MYIVLYVMHLALYGRGYAIKKLELVHVCNLHYQIKSNIQEDKIRRHKQVHAGSTLT